MLYRIVESHFCNTLIGDNDASSANIKWYIIAHAESICGPLQVTTAHIMRNGDINCVIVLPYIAVLPNGNDYLYQVLLQATDLRRPRPGLGPRGRAIGGIANGNGIAMALAMLMLGLGLARGLD